MEKIRKHRWALFACNRNIRLDLSWNFKMR